jgi:DNA helicase-2/ATP-dependent DNA helicase PcrA
MGEVELNEPQAEAVEHVNGPLLVFAGAGSGKTRVITYRIANLVAQNVAPYRILAVTFTNKAAGEMRSRLERICGAEIAKDLWVGTFHATCAKLLRRFGEPVGLASNFVIYDAADQKAVVNRVLKELDLDEKRYPPRAVLARIHKEKQEGRGADEMNVDSYMDEAIYKVFQKYEEHLRAANAVDFEDLILKTVKLLETSHGDEIRRRFRYVLVDEFQDTNRTQYRFLKELVRDHGNLCVVGDDDQSIYRWRGADVRNIRGFKKDFPGAKIVKLEQNYRSSGNIVRAALGVISPSREREPKELWTANDDGHPIQVIATRDERDEAALVLRAVEEARAEGIEPRQIAVFYRINAQSRVLEEAMRAARVPYQIIGGMRFYERAEIKDALSYLRLLVNPKSDVDLLRVINTPARGIGDTSVERLVAHADRANLSLYDALDRLEEAPDLAPAARKRLTGFRDLLRDLAATAKKAPPADTLAHVLEKTGYLATLRTETSAEADARLENLAELASSIADYEAEVVAAGEAPSLQGFLERVTLQSDIDEVGEQAGGRVLLMTVHSAKGLEFELVILTGMEEEMFPYRGLEPGSHEELEEERRLAYVAVTRARRRLIITHAEARQIFGSTRFGLPSRFLRDLPEDTVELAQTSAAAGPRSGRFMDRSSHAPAPASGPWRHPQAGSPPSRPSAPARAAQAAEETRYVDHEFFDDSYADDEVSLRRGSRVVHARFGEGEVRRVEHAAEPTVVAFFPGWGEKKILARYLKLA